MRITEPIAYTFPNAQSTPVMGLASTVGPKANSLGSILPHFPSDAASAVPEGSLLFGRIWMGLSLVKQDSAMISVKRFLTKALVGLILGAFAFSGCVGSPVFSSKEAIPTATPQVTLLSSSVTDHILTLTFRIHGLQVKSSEALDDMVCQPYIDTRENVPLTFFYRERHILADHEVIVAYKYRLRQPLPQELHLNILFTIGPCGPDFQETNVTASPMHLVASYKMQTVVKIP